MFSDINWDMAYDGYGSAPVPEVAWWSAYTKCNAVFRSLANIYDMSKTGLFTLTGCMFAHPYMTLILGSGFAYSLLLYSNFSFSSYVTDYLRESFVGV